MTIRASLHAAHVYMILGVVSGLYHRELTKHNGFDGDTQLSVVHTHLLALGMLAFLIVLALDKLFTLLGKRVTNRRNTSESAPGPDLSADLEKGNAL
ncbi:MULTISPECIES: DUF2871 family protein [unclassified Streptomyces]|uniref:DUF2871 family protein n=1 Tax=unclassified Streptomyces TaxID=2593676 RepID=UPI002E14B3A1|nr:MULTISPECIES: DUF2871 family protein [unclassified Streptomyces]WSJ55312.1 DUF2871 domain-containing protein [Streptomyces sp. NBC_01318]